MFVYSIELDKTKTAEPSLLIFHIRIPVFSGYIVREFNGKWKKTKHFGYYLGMIAWSLD